MTYKEKYMQDHPGYQGNLEMEHCPDLEGYCSSEELDGRACHNGRVPSEGACTKCWNKEIPETVGIIKINNDIPLNIIKHDEHRQTVGMGSIKDSGDRTEFASGAVRDMHEGKGRCDLLPLDIIAGMYNDGVEYVPEGYSEVVEKVYDILFYIHCFCDSGDVSWLYSVLETTKLFPNRETMLLEVAIHFEEGAKKYGDNNWRKGIPARCYIDSAVRHYLKCIRGDKDEPHDRAFVWNILCCIWTCKWHPELNEFKKEN